MLLQQSCGSMAATLPQPPPTVSDNNNPTRLPPSHLIIVLFSAGIHALAEVRCQTSTRIHSQSMRNSLRSLPFQTVDSQSPPRARAILRPSQTCREHHSRGFHRDSTERDLTLFEPFKEPRPTFRFYASRTLRTFLNRASGVKGFWRKATPESNTPW